MSPADDADPTSEIAELLVDSARRFAREGAHVERMRQLRGAACDFDMAVWQQIAALGWLGIRVPEALGGAELELGHLAAVARTLSGVLLPEPLVAVAGVAAPLIGRSGNRALVERLLPAVLEGRLVPALAWQEEGTAAEPMDFATGARKVGDDYILQGRKIHVRPGAGVDGFLVAASGDEGELLFWVPGEAPGLQISRDLCADGSWSGRIDLSEVRVPASDLLLEGDGTAAQLRALLDEGLLLSSAELLGLASSLFDQTLEYLKTRKQFGRPIGTNQAIRHRCVDLQVQLKLAESAVDAALGSLQRSTDETVRHAAASRAKARCAEVAGLVTREAVQLHGAMGYTDECDVSLYLKRALVLGAWQGNASYHRRRFLRFSGTPPGEREGEVAAEAVPFDPATDWDALPDEVFRATVRAYFEQRYPTHLRNPRRRMHWHETREWYLEMARMGWLANGWPKAHGGGGLSVSKQLIFMEEQERWGIARAPDMGVTLVGPTLIRFGTDDQRKRFLPSIIKGEHVWCQGYSEPNAGSDLASLGTEARLEGDEFVVTGRKIWTTLAQDATHMFALVRTDKTAQPRQAGISFLLLDLRSTGVTIRPIPVLSGHEEFCEVTFDEVRTPRENLVGNLNGGWLIAKSLLGFERIYLGSPKQSQFALTQLHHLAEERGLLNDPPFLDRFAALRLDVADLTSCYRGFCEIVRRGEALGPDVSVLKIWASETYQRIADLALEAAGEDAAIQLSETRNERAPDPLALFYNARPATIYGGSSEIQRDILAKEVLALPR